MEGGAIYRIGDFSRITNITVKALRYYDEAGVLAPSYRGENGYRYYDEGDVTMARLIVLLRDLDFGISEIKEVLANYDDESDLSYYLMTKKSMIEQRISKDKALIQKIKGHIKPLKMVRRSEYRIAIKDIAPVRVASIRFTGAYQDTGTYLRKLYRELKGHVQGAPFNCYYDNDYAEAADIEVCVPTNQYVNRNGIETKELPGIRAVCTVHRGSYDFFNYAYKAVFDYGRSNDIEYGLPTREIYRKGPGVLFWGNPNKYLTEIVIPCRSPIGQ